MSEHTYMRRGRVWKFGDNLNSDLMMPGYTLWGKVPQEELHMYCMRANRPEFARQVRPGDILVGGKNFGCGSSRPAAENLRALGIACLLADSFSQIFFRNTINLAMPMLSHPGVSATFGDGDIAEVNLRTGLVRNLTSGLVLLMEPLPDLLWRIIEAGGLFEFRRSSWFSTESP